METSIKIKRNEKYVASFRRFNIILDGENAGLISENQSISIAVEPGRHSLRMKLDWGGSEEINFDVDRGEEIRFECESNYSSPFRLLVYFFAIFFKPSSSWILLKQC